MADAHAQAGKYYVPHESRWPIIASASFFTLLLGAVCLLNEWAPAWALVPGFALVVFMFIGWFGDVIKENNAGIYGLDVDRSFRMGMMWFIFSEVMFFAAFFGALFYARVFSVPWLGGEGTKVMGNELLHPLFENAWPTNGPMKLGPNDNGNFEIIPAFGLPALNTLILLSSGVTVTIAHHALRAGKRWLLNTALAATFLLGFLFVFLQAREYMHAYRELNLTLGELTITARHGARLLRRMLLDAGVELPVFSDTVVNERKPAAHRFDPSDHRPFGIIISTGDDELLFVQQSLDDVAD